MPARMATASDAIPAAAPPAADETGAAGGGAAEGGSGGGGGQRIVQLDGEEAAAIVRVLETLISRFPDMFS